MGLADDRADEGSKGKDGGGKGVLHRKSKVERGSVKEIRSVEDQGRTPSRRFEWEVREVEGARRPHQAVTDALFNPSRCTVSGQK